MTDATPSSGHSWRYRLLHPGGAEIEQGEYSDDDAAGRRARELSDEHGSPVVVERHSSHVDDWEYVTEVG